MPIAGSSNLPIAPRGTPWNEAEAKRRVFEHCSTVAGISRAFLWRAQDMDARTPEAYSLGFCDVLDGQLHIIPKGLAIAAGRRGIGVFSAQDSDKALVRARITALYDRVRTVIEDWPVSPFAAASITADASGDAWEGTIAFEDLTTGDGRRIEAKALRWEDGPWPLIFDRSEMDHSGMVVGTVNEIVREGNEIRARGNLSDSEDPETQAAVLRVRELLAEGAVGVSMSTDDDESVSVDAKTGKEVAPEFEGDVVRLVKTARIRHVAIVDVPAFNRARVALVASVKATAEWFSNPRFGGGTKDPTQGGDDERLVWQEPEHPEEIAQFGAPLTITDDGRIWGHAALWGRCFAGETEYITEDGIRTLKETVGTVQRVLTSRGGLGSAPRAAREFGGEWVDAEIRAFGVQPLMKVTLRRFGQMKEVYATPEHRWLVTPIGHEGFRHSPRKIVMTKELHPGARLSPLFPKRKVTVGKGIRPSQFGVAHGFTFGDGNRRRDGCEVKLWGAKDEALLPYFALSTAYRKKEPNGIPTVKVRNLPAFFKDLPSRGESLSYLYGWLAGYFAADGTVSELGTPTMFSSVKGHLEAVRDICLRLGIGTSEIKTFMRRGARTSAGGAGVVNDVVSPLHRITFVATTLSAEFFILAEHRRRFEARPNKADPYTAWRVVSVEETDRIEEVYCAVVPGTENFTLLDNINVMNCHVGYAQTCVRPPKEPAAYRGYLTGERIRGIPTGPLILRTTHAPDHLTAEAAQVHYDHTGYAGADLTIGPDAYGIWVAGAVRSDASESDIEVMRASALSGDWRPVSGRHRLIGVLAVSGPGFRVARALAASGALVTIGPGCTSCDDSATFEDRLLALERYIADALVAGL